MTIAPSQTLLVLLVGVGCYGAVRGPYREIWTVGGMALLAIFLNFGGLPLLKQLPVHFAASIQALSGDQHASNETAAHPIGEPWTIISLWVCTLALILLAYTLGHVLGKPKGKEQNAGEMFGGFILGAINGLIISVFVFQSSFSSSVNIQFPDGTSTRGLIIPLILFSICAAIYAITIRKKPAAAKSGS